MRTAKHIKSFVLRAGRITDGQARALQELWPRYGIDFENSAVDLDVAFGRHVTRRLEIGFGIGEVIGALAKGHPEVDFLGIEVQTSALMSSSCLNGLNMPVDPFQ